MTLFAFLENPLAAQRQQSRGPEPSVLSCGGRTPQRAGGPATLSWVGQAAALDPAPRPSSHTLLKP